MTQQFHFWVYSQKTWKQMFKRHQCPEVHSSATHNNQKVEMSINWRMNKQNVAYPYNDTLFGQKKEWSTDTCCNMDKPWKHYVK